MQTPIPELIPQPDIDWSRLPQPTPYPVVQMIVTDGRHILIIHRSDKVRSARNLWSLPSGLHDIGETRQQCAARELLEEFNLTARLISFVGAYENIVLSEPQQFHWVIQTCVVQVDNFNDLVNHEPDKHDEFRLLPICLAETMTDDYVFSQKFCEFWEAHLQAIMYFIRTFTR